MQLRWPSRRAEPGVFRRGSHLASVRHGDKVVLMDLDREQFYSLDGVAGRLWDLLEAPATVDQLTTQLAIEYDAPNEILRRDVAEFLAELERDGLLQGGR